jgi:hypothetical protein
MATSAVKKGSQDNVTVMLVMFDRCDVDSSLAGLGDLPGATHFSKLPNSFLNIESRPLVSNMGGICCPRLPRSPALTLL